ncbi:MAG: flap endonuclease-1 [Promethearchaeia archaeon]|nr:MAG: flap endonuclease-1 [Candidatus Lokiarchaeia archaeon]
MILLGVDLNPLVKDVKKLIKFEDLVGKRIAIDAFNTIYQFLAIIRGRDGTPLKDYQGNVTSHLSGLFYRSLNLIEHDIRPIFVFDGNPNPFKQAEIERRREIRLEARKKFEEARDLGETETAAKYAQASSKLTSEMIQESKELLVTLGIPVVDAAQDGESQAAYLVSTNKAWAVGSQDYDAFLFGAERVIRNLSMSRTRKVRSTTITVDLEWLNLKKILEHTHLSREQLIDIGILVGVDFFPGIKGVGVKTAYKLVQEHQSLEAMLEKDIEIRHKKITDSLDINTMKAVKEIFLNPVVNNDIPPLKWKSPQVEKVREILVEKHNFNPERVDSGLNRLKKRGTARQRSISDFFTTKKE